MAKKSNLKHELKVRLKGRCVMTKTKNERNKSQDKLEGLSKEKIYSWETLHSYEKQCGYLIEHCLDTHKKDIKRLDDCKQYVNEWLQHGVDRGLSPYTLKLQASAAAKLFGCSTTDFIQTPKRTRTGISRSRNECVRDNHFSESKNADLVHFCRHTGLRRHELVQLRGSDLRWIDGRPYVHVERGKGGRSRNVPVLNQDRNVIEKMKAAGNGLVWPDGINSNADIHSYRRDFATAMYRSLERDLKKIPRNEKYFCRGDKAGTVYDKMAMKEVTEALGHSRLSVIAGHYLQA